MNTTNEEIDKTAISVEEIIENIKPIFKDVFVAKVRKTYDGLKLEFTNGQSFTVAVWENKKY